jgi:hypothetical protein
VTRRGAFPLAAVLACLTLVPGASAQTSSTAKPEPKQPPTTSAPPAKPAQPAKPARPAKPPGPPALTIAGFAETGVLGFSAAESFDAVYGSSSGLAWGGGVRVAHRSGLFGQVSATTYSDVGERVFVDGSAVFPLGIESRLTITPLDFTAGWRFAPKPKKPKAPAANPPAKPARPVSSPAAPRGEQATPAPKPAPAPAKPATPAATSPTPPRGFFGSLVPYVGGGVGVVLVKEEADFAATSDDVSDSHSSYHALAGVEIPISKWFGADVEAGLRWVPDALAGSGVAEAFGEQDLNHFFLMVRFRIGR